LTNVVFETDFASLDAVVEEEKINREGNALESV
jgi:hypothetical protein